MKKPTQLLRVFKLLQKHTIVPLPRLLDLRISGFRARISGLRNIGCVITNAKVTVSGRVLSIYTLEKYPKYLEKLLTSKCR